MALLTAGSIATGAGFIWKFWRVPVRLWEWHKAEEVEPAPGQLWRSAGFSGKNSDLKVVSCDDHHIILKSPTDKDHFGDPVEHYLDWDHWEKMVKGKRLYCKDTNTSVEDRYFGEHSED